MMDCPKCGAAADGLCELSSDIHTCLRVVARARIQAAENAANAAADNVNHPRHYTSHPSGVECIQITRHMSFNVGNAVKYLWRADLKGATIEDLKKARWYIDDEIKLREQGNG